MVTSSRPESFTYDALGNRRSGPGVKDTLYRHNEGNQMIQGRRFQYLYDDNGNQTTRVMPDVSDKSWIQSWDHQNRLVKVEKVKGTERKTVTFSYDPQGRRVGKRLVHAKDGITRASTWSYVYDNDNIILEIVTDDNGVTKTFFTHGLSVDEHLAMEKNGQISYYHTDGLGSVVAITDQKKQVLQSYQYDSFGKPTASTSFANIYTYTGREWDKETGLYYYRARYYDPMEERFISKDPTGMNGGDVNLYAYVENNPINWFDPTGLFKLLKVHGEWCGPDWTGGRVEEYDPSRDVGGYYKPPIDTLDAACEVHDKCYYSCRKQFPCEKRVRGQCFLVCDRALSSNASEVGGVAGHAVATAMNRSGDRIELNSCQCGGILGN
jgi:RHS repeat-associated protein